MYYTVDYIEAIKFQVKQFALLDATSKHGEGERATPTIEEVVELLR